MEGSLTSKIAWHQTDAKSVQQYDTYASQSLWHLHRQRHVWLTTLGASHHHATKVRTFDKSACCPQPNHGASMCLVWPMQIVLRRNCTMLQFVEVNWKSSLKYSSIVAFCLGNQCFKKYQYLYKMQNSRRLLVNYAPVYRKARDLVCRGGIIYCWHHADCPCYCGHSTETKKHQVILLHFVLDIIFQCSHVLDSTIFVVL